jgi:hypothetical protein
VKAPVLDNLPPAIKAVKPVETPVLVSTFTIQGDATVFNYDASAGIIETYEGQNFAVDNSASGSSAKTWQDYAGNLHYTCDQTGNCTLAGAGVVVLNAKRAS